ncbi:MAG TPA: YggT family protein [Firmicutes bacterium]|nr:YggT family protein [Bacillota bacterium]
MEWILALANVILDFFTWAIILRALFSWIAPERGNAVLQNIQRGLYRVTEPILAPIRRTVKVQGLVDFSPVIALLIIYWIRRLLVILLR